MYNRGVDRQERVVWIRCRFNVSLEVVLSGTMSTRTCRTLHFVCTCTVLKDVLRAARFWRTIQCKNTALVIAFE
jgi:hypothetical protein